MADSFEFTVKEGFDYVLEEAGNSSTNLRMVDWGNNGNYKLDIRKWSYQNGQERAMKGTTLTEDGANELTHALTENGYGDTKQILRNLSTRKDFESALNSYNEPDPEQEEQDGYYDPKELVG